MLRWLPLWLLPQLAMAAQLTIGWDFPRSYTPQPTAFLITYSGEDQALHQMQTPPSVAGACDRLPGATVDTFCTLWPTCPPPGVMTFWVQAQWDADTVSDRTDPLALCLFTADAPCICHDPATYTPPAQAAPVVLPPLPPMEIPPITTVRVPPPPPFQPTNPPAPA